MIRRVITDIEKTLRWREQYLNGGTEKEGEVSASTRNVTRRGDNCFGNSCALKRNVCPVFAKDYHNVMASSNSSWGSQITTRQRDHLINH